MTYRAVPAPSMGQSICTPPVPLMLFGTSSVPVRSKRSVPLLITSPVPRRAGRAVVADLQRAGADGGVAGVGVRAREDEFARRARACEAARAADVAVEDEGAAVGGVEGRVGAERDGRVDVVGQLVRRGRAVGAEVPVRFTVGISVPLLSRSKLPPLIVAVVGAAVACRRA